MHNMSPLCIKYAAIKCHRSHIIRGGLRVARVYASESLFKSLLFENDFSLSHRTNTIAVTVFRNHDWFGSPIAMHLSVCVVERRRTNRLMAATQQWCR